MALNNKQSLFLLWLVYLFIASCSSSHTLAPVVEGTHQPDQMALKTTANESVAKLDSKVLHHIVKSGDTLYSIAWDYNLDYREVTRWNNIHAPYIIYPAQSIRLTMPDEQQIPIKKVIKEKPINSQESWLEKPVDQVNWQWPTIGKVVRSNSLISRKGIDILGTLEQPIQAAAPGIVVYSGNVLLGYGNLVIIKHNERYLSAYAHNSSIVVQEGDSVLIGQQIAKMGQDSSGAILLHFEIRKDGLPIDPLQYLPSKEVLN